MVKLSGAPEHVPALRRPSQCPVGLKLNPCCAPAAQIPVLVRIEVDTSSFLQFQVTVATPDGMASAAIKDLLCTQILAIVA